MIQSYTLNATDSAAMPTIAEIGLYNYMVLKNIPGLKENATARTIKKGEQLYDAAQPYTDIFEIESGAVKLGNTSDKGREFIYELVTPGEFFGNLAVLQAGTFSESCRALVPTRLRAYKVPFFKHIMTHDPEVAEWCFKRIVARWNKTESRLAHIRSYEPRERIQVLYADLLDTKIVVANRYISLGSLVTYQDIADLTATTRQLAAETLNTL